MERQRMIVRLLPTLATAICGLIAFSVGTSTSCIAQPKLEVKPDIKVDADAKVVGLDASRETTQTNKVLTETHIDAAEGSDVTSVSFNFVGLSGGAAVLVAALYFIGKLMLRTKAQRAALGDYGVALDRLVQAIEKAIPAGPVPEPDGGLDAWGRGSRDMRKGIKKVVDLLGVNIGKPDRQDRAGRIIEKHVSYLKRLSEGE